MNAGRSQRVRRSMAGGSVFRDHLSREPTGGVMSEARAAWGALDAPWRPADEEGLGAWSAGCFGIGCVVVDGHGSVVARGRNRVLERATEPRLLAETLIAHAEMNALATLDLDRGTGEDLSLYTTLEPCLMCASTLVMVRV